MTGALAREASPGRHGAVRDAAPKGGAPMTQATWLLTPLVLLTTVCTALGAPIVGTSAGTLPQGKFMLDVWAVWQDFSKDYRYDLSDASGQYAGWEDLSDAKAYTSASFVPRLYYGATDWLTVRLAVPLEDRFRDFPTDEGGQAMSTGLGDMVFDPKMLVYKGESGYPLVSLLAGVRFPTGDTESEIPLSDGSTDFCGGLAATHKAGDLTVHISSVYWLNGEGYMSVDGERRRGDLPDQTTTTLTIEDALSANWSLEWEARATVCTDPDRYYRVYACPGLAWTDGGKLTVGMSGLVSVAGKGCPLLGRSGTLDFNVAPYLRVYYRF
jgi:hypothetical protein